MSKQRHDISDDEIRIISPSGTPQKTETEHRNDKRIWLRRILFSLPILAVITLIIINFTKSNEEDLKVEELSQNERIVVMEDNAISSSATEEGGIVTSPDSPQSNEKAFVTVRDTTVCGTGLRILTPENATPSLMIGQEALSDSLAVLAVQAADVRADNGKIAGTYVLKGELLSKGQAKSGFCAIINGELTIGIADATPMLENAIESEGYFFRQYPLVVGGQIVENKPKGKSLRKALAEIDGNISVILSKEKLTFHDFSQALVDAGVRNAIYLPGSTAAGVYTDREGKRYKFGRETDSQYENINYIIWQ